MMLQLLIEDPLASRKHMICRTSPQGIIVENLSTTNPVEVNTEQVSAPRLLQDGDTLKIGSGLFRFHSNGEQMGDTKDDIDFDEEEHSPDTIFDETEDKGGLAEINFDLVDSGDGC